MCLCKQIRQVTIAAQAGGALKPLNTSVHVTRDNGVSFVLRTLQNIAEKEKRTKEGKKQGKNPFLPHEPSMFVREVGTTHKLLLNKFPVIFGHVLLCTKDFQRQTDPLRPADFACLWAVFGMLEQDPHLAFYNFGAHSGRSQPHKHVQLVPLPLTAVTGGNTTCQQVGRESEVKETPLDAIIRKEGAVGNVAQLSCFPFEHGVVKLDIETSSEPSLETGEKLTAVLRSILDALGLEYASCANDAELSYNVLVTREWMMVVPRSAEEFEGFKINAVGFAGSLLVQNEGMRAKAEKMGPVHILSKVAHI